MTYIFNELYIKDHLFLFWSYIIVIILIIILTIIFVHKELKNKK